MSPHENINEFTNDILALYAQAHLIREKAIHAGAKEIAVDVRSCMDDVIAKIDTLTQALAQDILCKDVKEAI